LLNATAEFVETLMNPSPMNAATIRRQPTEARALERRARPHEAAWVAKVKDFERAFPNESACLEFAMARLLPNGVARCAKCGAYRKHHRVNGRKAYACDRCGRHIHPLSRTLFARSSTPLQKWFYAVWLLASADGPVTAKRVQRELRVTYKTAWRILRRLRAAALPAERDLLRLLEAVIVPLTPWGAQGASAALRRGQQYEYAKDTNHDLA
jgi:transposase-like protein